MVTKAVERNLIKFLILLSRNRPKQFLSFFVHGFKWNQTAMRWNCISRLHNFLQILANYVDSMFNHYFFFVWKYFKNALYRKYSNFAIIEAATWYREIQKQVKHQTASLRCQTTSMSITHFHLYTQYIAVANISRCLC